MNPKKPLVVLMTALIGIGAACGGTDATAAGTTASDTTVADTAASDSAESSATAATTDTTTTTSTTESSTTTAAMSDGGPGGGPGSGMSVDAVSTVDDLVTLIQEAYGDPSLGLQRGHQPVEATLIEVLGISHDEMHVRMDAGQNLAAVATDLGIDPQKVIDALVESWSPAIENLVAAGTITDDEATAYAEALDEAFTFRVTWNGTDATPSFTGV